MLSAPAGPWRLLLLTVVLLATISQVNSFNVGPAGTKCNLDPSKGDINDPCKSLYEGVCGGKHCKCPANMHLDPGLVVCVPGAPVAKPSGGVDLFDDLPFDYEPPGNRKPTTKPAVQPPPQPPPPQIPPQPQPGPPPQPQPGYNPNQPQPGYNPNQPQPGYNPNQPQPGYNPNQPQPGYNPNQPGVKPTQPGAYNPNQPGYSGGGSKKTGSSSDDSLAEEAGGGVGGVLGLGLFVGLIYFCCCRGEKGKANRQRFQGLPFANRSNNQNVAMQQPDGTLDGQITQQDPNFASQHSYVPPGGVQQAPPPQGGYTPVPQQPGYAPPPQPGYAPPPQGYAPGYAPPPQPGYAPPQGYPGAQPPPGYGQQPPPAYTQQYQPQAPV